MTPVTLKEWMLTDSYLNKQIARRPARRPGLTLATETNTIARIDAWRHFDRQGFGFFYQPLAATRYAGIGNGLAAATTLGAGLLHLEKPLLHAYLPCATATAASNRATARLSTAAIAGLTVLQRRNPDLGSGATNRFLQCDFEGVTQV
jgi:hypothetical protein